MRITSTVLILFLFVSCQPKKENQQKPKFLIGQWKRLNDTEGNQTFETWNSDYTGFGYTLNNKKTTFQEELKIVRMNDQLVLEVTGVNEKPTLFHFTHQTDTSFVCENPQNEFPKQITYLKDGNFLKAIVASDDFRIDFVFEKIR